MPVKSSPTMIAIRKTYDTIEYALWAILAAFVIYFLIYSAFNMPEMMRRAESARAADHAAENSSYCEKWGMKPGTHEYTLCTMDLQEFRKQIEREDADDASLL